MKRNEIYWADLGLPAGRRAVCVVTRNAAITALDRLTCAPLTRTIRGIDSELEVGPEHGLWERGVINCDNLITVLKTALDARPVGTLDTATRARLGQALRYALDIVY